MSGFVSKDTVHIRRLEVGDVAALAALWGEQRQEYVCFFQPFGAAGFAEEALRESLAGLREDVWWGMWSGEDLGGFFMLRGKDAGYARYAFGVLIGERFAGRGWGRRALEEAVSWARQRGERSVMLSVAEENVVARRMYEEFGFGRTGEISGAGQPIFEIELLSKEST